MTRLTSLLLAVLLLASCASSDHNEEAAHLREAQTLVNNECRITLTSISAVPTDDAQMIEDACSVAASLIEISHDRYRVPVLLGHGWLRAPDQMHLIWPVMQDEFMTLSLRQIRSLERTSLE